MTQVNGAHGLRVSNDAMAADPSVNAARALLLRPVVGHLQQAGYAGNGTSRAACWSPALIQIVRISITSLSVLMLTLSRQRCILSCRDASLTASQRDDGGRLPSRTGLRSNLFCRPIKALLAPIASRRDAGRYRPWLLLANRPHVLVASALLSTGDNRPPSSRTRQLPLLARP